MDLITGATGFIGSNLVRALQRGKKVRVLVRKDSNIDSLKNRDIEIFHGDLNNISSLEKATKNIDTVYHLAGFIGDDKTSYSKFKEINVDGTENLVKACIKNNVRKLVFTSTIAVMGSVLNADERIKCNPYTKYGKSKFEAEKILIENSDKINTTILRLALVYGKNQSKDRGLTQIFNNIARGRFIIFGRGDNLMPLVHIDDVINAMLLAGKDKKTGKVYIIAGESVKLKDIAEIITKAKKIKSIKHAPYFLGYVAGFLLEIIDKITGIKTPLTLKKFKRLVESRSFNTEKAKKELGWTAKTKLKDAVSQII